MWILRIAYCLQHLRWLAGPSKRVAVGVFTVWRRRGMMYREACSEVLVSGRGQSAMVITGGYSSERADRRHCCCCVLLAISNRRNFRRPQHFAKLVACGEQDESINDSLSGRASNWPGELTAPATSPSCHAYITGLAELALAYPYARRNVL